MTRLWACVINLDGSSDRLVGARDMLDKINLPFKRLPAFDGRGQPSDSLPDYDPQTTRRRFGRKLSGGEVGCYLSHLRAAEEFLASGCAYGLVLEDDLGITHETGEMLPKLLDWLDDHPDLAWDIMNLGAKAQRYFRTVPDFPGSNPLCHAFYFPVTTTALLWSRAGATAFLAQGRPILMPIDHFLRKWASASGRGMAFRTALFPDRRLESEIDKTEARQRSKRHWIFWLHRQRQLWSYKAFARKSMKRFMEET